MASYKTFISKRNLRKKNINPETSLLSTRLQLLCDALKEGIDFNL